MTRSFNCASCSAPLEFEGKTMQKCQFCGSTVIAPPEMFYASNAAPFGDFSALTGKALKIAEIDQLIHDGKKIEAIKVFRETFGVGLKEAKDAVERMERGESVDISGMQIRSAKKIDIGPEGAKAVKAVGAAVGGTILVTILLSAFVVIVGVATAVYFAFSSVEKNIPIVSNGSTPSPSPSAKPTEVPGVPDAVEVMKIGGEGNGIGRFKDNRHVAVDGRGNIYSSDYSPFRIQVFDASGKFLNMWQTDSGTNLYGLAADREGNIYIANDKGLFKYEGLSGKPLAKVERFYPRDVALTWDGKVIATAGKSIAIFDSNLKVVKEIKDAAEQASSTFGFERIATDGSGTIYGLDRTEDDICKFSSEGKFLNRFPSHASSPHNIAVDPKGRLFISETNEIRVLDSNGQLIKTIDSDQAFGIAFNEDGELFIASRPYVIKQKLNF